jgi:protease IV
MNFNSIINEIGRGYWAVELGALPFWASVANNIMAGKALGFSIDKAPLITVYNDQGKMVPRSKDGQEVPEGSIAFLNVEGILMPKGDVCIDGAADIVSALMAIDRNPDFIATVIYWNGPGGAVSAIAPFVQFRAVKKKPIVSIYEQACSAHAFAMYPVSDYIFAANDISATIGSHGVVYSMKDNSKFLESQGLKVIDVYPDESEHKNLAVRYALEGKFEMIKSEMLSPMAQRVQKIVTDFRPKVKGEVSGVLTGKTFFAPEAIQYGLADAIGTVDDALQKARILGEINRVNKNQK